MVEEAWVVILFGKLLALIIISANIFVYVILPYINSMTGPYYTVTYTTRRIVKPEPVKEPWELELYDRNGNVIK
jgi:hypothetical protein